MKNITLILSLIKKNSKKVIFGLFFLHYLLVIFNFLCKLCRNEALNVNKQLVATPNNRQHMFDASEFQVININIRNIYL